MNSLSSPVLFEDFDIAAVFGGGNALGAYHLGVCEGLVAAGLEPSWLVGASIGAVTAALYAGSAPDDRVELLRGFWREAAQPSLSWLDAMPHQTRAYMNNVQALTAFLMGRPGLFARRYPGLWSILPGMPPDVALRDSQPLIRTLERFVDFDRLNHSEIRLSVLALDMETGEEVWFDSREHTIRAEHIVASCALAPLFPPLEIDGRLLCDAGLGNNLPFDRVFREGSLRNTLCIASDLFHPEHGRPETLDQTVARAQDLAFAIQTKRSVAALAREQALMRQHDPNTPSSILAHLAYQPVGHQRGLKSLDFSVRSLEERILQGKADFELMLPHLRAAPLDSPFAYLPPASERVPEVVEAP